MLTSNRGISFTYIVTSLVSIVVFRICALLTEKSFLKAVCTIYFSINKQRLIKPEEADYSVWKNSLDTYKPVFHTKNTWKGPL